MATAAADNSRRIALLGKTGHGKSSLANTILGERGLFEVFHTSVSGTKVCKSEKREVHGRNVQLIDTPGVFDTDPNESDMKKEVLNCMIECADGVHAFLLVLKVEKFTKHELNVAELFYKQFSEEALKYTTVVFTQGDQLQEGTTIQKWLEDNVELSELVKKCGGRCHVFDNKYWNNSQDSYRNNEFQLKELVKTIDQTVQKNKRCYTNENLKVVQEKIKEEKQLIKAAPENANLSEEEVEKKAKKNTFSTLWPTLGGLITGVGAVLGIVALLRR